MARLSAFCHWLPSVSASCLILLGGCGCSSDIVPVSGRVTLDGEPLADAVVTFQPLANRDGPQLIASGSVGRTDKEGRFVLRLISPERPGAAVGEHAVTISTSISSGSDASPPKGERTPKAWRDGSQRFRVPAGGTKEANFEIVR